MNKEIVECLRDKYSSIEFIISEGSVYSFIDRSLKHEFMKELKDDKYLENLIRNNMYDYEICETCNQAHLDNSSVKVEVENWEPSFGTGLGNLIINLIEQRMTQLMGDLNHKLISAECHEYRFSINELSKKFKECLETDLIIKKILSSYKANLKIEIV